MCDTLWDTFLCRRMSHNSYQLCFGPILAKMGKEKIVFLAQIGQIFVTIRKKLKNSSFSQKFEFFSVFLPKTVQNSSVFTLGLGHVHGPKNQKKTQKNSVFYSGHGPLGPDHIYRFWPKFQFLGPNKYQGISST